MQHLVGNFTGFYRSFGQALGVSIRRRHAALAGGVASTGQTPTAHTLSAASLVPPLLALAAAECARLGSAYILALLWLGLG